MTAPTPAVIKARKLLADRDPISEAMEVLAAAGCHSVVLRGTTRDGVRFTVEGGAPKPAKTRTTLRAPPGGDLRTHLVPGEETITPGMRDVGKQVRTGRTR